MNQIANHTPEKFRPARLRVPSPPFKKRKLDDFLRTPVCMTCETPLTNTHQYCISCIKKGFDKNLPPPKRRLFTQDENSPTQKDDHLVTIIHLNGSLLDSIEKNMSEKKAILYFVDTIDGANLDDISSAIGLVKLLGSDTLDADEISTVADNIIHRKLRKGVGYIKGQISLAEFLAAIPDFLFRKNTRFYGKTIYAALITVLIKMLDTIAFDMREKKYKGILSIFYFPPHEAPKLQVIKTEWASVIKKYDVAIQDILWVLRHTDASKTTKIFEPKDFVKVLFPTKEDAKYEGSALTKGITKYIGSEFEEVQSKFQ